jgi:hypothetical protein
MVVQFYLNLSLSLMIIDFLFFIDLQEDLTMKKTKTKTKKKKRKRLIGILLIHNRFHLPVLRLTHRKKNKKNNKCNWWLTNSVFQVKHTKTLCRGSKSRDMTPIRKILETVFKSKDNLNWARDPSLRIQWLNQVLYKKIKSTNNHNSKTKINSKINNNNNSKNLKKRKWR